jgi:hypothetical protein
LAGVGTSASYRLTHTLETGEKIYDQHNFVSQPNSHYNSEPRQSTRNSESGTNRVAGGYESRPIASRPSYNHGQPSYHLPDSAICGVAISSVGLIKGGFEYRRGDWPWLAALVHLGKFSCGGTLSNDYIFLTLLLTLCILCSFQ